MGKLEFTEPHYDEKMSFTWVPNSLSDLIRPSVHRTFDCVAPKLIQNSYLMASKRVLLFTLGMRFFPDYLSKPSL